MGWIDPFKRFIWLWMVLSSPWLLPAYGLEISYQVRMPNPVDHLFSIQMSLSGITGDVLDVQMPAWSPGRYLILNFARNISDFSAESPDGSLSFEKTDKQTWRIQTESHSQITLRYNVYGNNLSGELSQLNDVHAFLDGGSLYMYVVGHKDNPVSLDIVPPSGWMVLSSAGESDQTHFQFSNYDRLIDELVQVGKFFVERFTVGGTEFRVSIVNDGERGPIPAFVEKVHAIAESALTVLGPLDTSRYTFFYHFLPDSRNSAGMEHLNGCQLTRLHDLRDTGSMMDLTIWVTAHEMVHAWNGKRLRPQGLGPFDYTGEVYTDLLWFEEGCTSYLADLILLRSGVWSQKQFFGQLAEQITNFRSSPGIHQRSPEEASFDTWLWPIDSSRESDWNNTWTSYYISGELLGMCMDLEMRQRSKNEVCFEDFFQRMYSRFYTEAQPDTYYLPGQAYTTTDLINVLEDTTQTSWSTFDHDFIATPGDIPFELFLSYAGLELQPDEVESSTPYTGLHLTSAGGGFPQSLWIEPKSPAQRAGLSTQDILIALDGERVFLRDFDAVLRRHAIDQEVTVTFLREDRLLNATMQLNPQQNIVQYKIVESEDSSPLALQIRKDWLRSYNASTSVPWKRF